MKLPRFFNRETRAQSSYTDLVVQQLLSTSAGDVAQGYTCCSRGSSRRMAKGIFCGYGWRLTG